MAKNQPHVLQREVGAALNNALLLARETQHFLALRDKGPGPELSRKRRLWAYTEAHVNVIKEHVHSKRLHEDEAILILIGEAILIAGLFYKGVKLPAFGDAAKALLDGDPEQSELNNLLDDMEVPREGGE
jgi:hypothetical protein